MALVIVTRVCCDMKNLTAIQEALTTQGKELGVEIREQHADIFLSMHRVG